MEKSQGLLHIYCGEGKGKTTAALGLAIRAAGQGMKVVIARFLKTDNSGEVKMLKRLPGVTLLPCTKTFGFTISMKESEKKEASKYYHELLFLAAEQARQADLLILDEALAACNTGLLKKKDLEELLIGRPQGLEVVLTGRNPWETLLNMADYVTEMQAVKHPYQKGLPARRGIEY